MASPGLAKFEGASDLSFWNVVGENSCRITYGRLTWQRTNLRPAKKYERTLCLHRTVCLNRETLNS